MLIIKSKSGGFTLPSAWFEINLKQYTALYEKRLIDEEGEARFGRNDMAKILVSDPEAYAKADAGEIDHLVNEWLDTLGPMPNWLMEDPPYTVADVCPPAEIGACTQLQVESARMIISDMAEEQETVDYNELAIPLIAIFLYPLLTKKMLTDTDQIEEILPIVEAIPITEGLPLAAFFLLNLNSLKRTMSLSYHVEYPKLSRKDKLMKWFRNWRNSRKWHRSVL